MFITYALYSPSADKFYIGQTNDLQRRLLEHNGTGNFKSWATRYRPWHLLHSESFETRAASMSREKFLKSGIGREFLKTILAGWSPPPADSSLGS